MLVNFDPPGYVYTMGDRFVCFPGSVLSVFSVRVIDLLVLRIALGGDRIPRGTGIHNFIVSSCNHILYIQTHHFTQNPMLNQSLYYTIRYYEPQTLNLEVVETTTPW